MASDLKSSITKSRSGHYTVTIKSVAFGRLFIARKISSLDHARKILKESCENLLKGENFVCRYDCLYSVVVSNLNKYLAR